MRGWIEVLVILAITALLVVAVAVRESPEKGVFAGGPQIRAEGLELDLPPLRIRRSRDWDREQWRILVPIRGERPVPRTSWRPPADDPVVRQLRSGGGQRDPQLPYPERWPAYLLAGDAASSGYEVMRAMRWLMVRGGPGRIYLAGREPGGTLGAIPLVVDEVIVSELYRMGANVVPREGSVIVRITRTDGGIRFRWRDVRAGRRAGRIRWDRGDVTVDEAATLGSGEGPLLPALANLLVVRRASGEEGVTVWIETGTGVRYADVLRVVECGGGDPRIVFGNVHALRTNTLVVVRLPDPEEPALGALLREDAGQGRYRVVVTLEREGRITVRGKEVGVPGVRARLSEAAETHPQAGLLLRADRDAPARLAGAILATGIERGLHVELAFVAGDPQIPWERVLALPGLIGVSDVKAVRPVPLATGGVGLPPDPAAIEGAGVHLSVPADARVGELARMLIELARRGAVGFAFDWED
jgi:hypothetical protein